jgi:hypothetical protein
VSSKPQTRSRAYRFGWQDGRCEDPGCFTDNHRLAGLTTPSDRLDYYRGHRASRESRLRDNHLPEAS